MPVNTNCVFTLPVFVFARLGGQRTQVMWLV